MVGIQPKTSYIQIRAKTHMALTKRNENPSSVNFPSSYFLQCNLFCLSPNTIFLLNTVHYACCYIANNTHIILILIFCFFLSLSFHLMCVWLFLCLFNPCHHQETCTHTHKHTKEDSMKYHVFTVFVFFFQSIQNIVVISYRSKY